MAHKPRMKLIHAGQLECEAGDFYDQLRSTASQKLTDLNVLADIFVNIHQYMSHMVHDVQQQYLMRHNEATDTVYI